MNNADFILDGCLFIVRSMVSLDDLSLSHKLSADGSTQSISKSGTPNSGSELGLCNEVSTANENIETETFQ